MFKGSVLLAQKNFTAVGFAHRRRHLGVFIAAALMSRIERKYCLISTSYLPGLFDIFILLNISHNCVCFGCFLPMTTLRDAYHKEFESLKADLQGTTLSHTASLRQAYDMT